MIGEAPAPRPTAGKTLCGSGAPTSSDGAYRSVRVLWLFTEQDTPTLTACAGAGVGGHRQCADTSTTDTMHSKRA